MKQNKTKGIVAALLLLAIGYAAAYFTKPAEVIVETKEVIKYREAKNIVIREIKYVYPDGTVKEEKVTEDKGVISEDTIVDSSSKTLNRDLGVRLGLYRAVKEQQYSLHLESPALLKLWKMQLGVGASVTSDMDAAVGLYVQF